MQVCDTSRPLERWGISDAEWERVEPLMPQSAGRRGRPFADHRTVVEAMLYRRRVEVAWRDLPSEFGPWQTVWKRYRRFVSDGTWTRILAELDHTTA